MRIAPKALEQYNSAAREQTALKRSEALNLQARVKTSEVGFKAGSFGVSFTSRKVEFEQDEAGKSSEFLRSKSYSHTQDEELDIISLRHEMNSGSHTEDRNSDLMGVDIPRYLRTRAVSAYRSLASVSEYIPGRALGKV
ncbi:hypothetical protein [Maridesulfovibrio bastinii]|uniref:hypothetical protein n=1 Tax=Maridesulfovibrio bastinii TaxID=47157 RepID=UPI000426B62C|nr:hypothetical protein [Maridesulfovibrio bastinii]